MSSNLNPRENARHKEDEKRGFKINEENSGGYLPIHLAAERGRTKLIELLLKFDPDAASKEINGGSQHLPLHFACNNSNLSSIQALYDAYPDAIFARTDDAVLSVFARNRGGRTPLDFARKQPVMDFLQTQLEYARQAQDMTAMTTVDDDGWLPLHRALKGNASLGSIKLLIRVYPAAVQVSDQKGAYPLHIACEFSSVKVVKYLVDIDGGFTLNNVDANKDSSLHYACRGGILNVLKYLLEANAPSVSEKEMMITSLLFICCSSAERMYLIRRVWNMLKQFSN